MTKHDTLRVLAEDKNKLLNECKEEFLRHHPEFKGKNITQSHLFAQVVKFYLES